MPKLKLTTSGDEASTGHHWRIVMRGIITAVPNYKLVPITIVESIEEFNKIIKFCKDNNYNKMIRTKSGGISYKDVFNGNSYDVRIYPSTSEIVIGDLEGYRRIQLRRGGDLLNEEEGISGEQAFKKLTNNYKLVKDIDEVQEKLDKWYQIKLLGPYQDIVIENASHIDLNSAFPYYLQEILPEFKDNVNYHYKNRKVNELSKAVMNYGIGCMRRRMKNTWEKIMHLVKERLEAEVANIDGTVLAFNTDGIWFTGKWNGTSSNELGQFKLDHENVKIRFKSAGAYEYIENGIYYPVQRGVKLELNKEWGDIYKHNPKVLKLNKDGYIEEVEYIYES